MPPSIGAAQESGVGTLGPRRYDRYGEQPRLSGRFGEGTRAAADGRLPTAIQSLQFLHQWSWKGLVRSPKAAARKEHGTDHDSLWPIALCLDQFSPTVPLLPVGTMPRANGAPNPATAQVPMPAPVPCASNRNGCLEIRARPISLTSNADASPATDAAR